MEAVLVPDEVSSFLQNQVAGTQNLYDQVVFARRLHTRITEICKENDKTNFQKIMRGNAFREVYLEYEM